MQSPDIPRLSVLVPAWNAAATIERTLDSVLEERQVALECIVIDDGSTDGTREVVGAVAERDPRVVLESLPANVGVSEARNRGLELARGEWLTFVDADDRLLPGAVAALMRPTQSPGVLAVIGQRIWSDGERTWIRPEYDKPDIRVPGRKSIAAHPGLLSYMSTTGRVLHRSLIEDLRFYGRVLGDQPWTIRALLRAGDGIEVIGDVVYEWTRPHADRYVPTVTSGKRRSTAKAAEMIGVARSALEDVSREVDDRIGDDATRLRVKRAYLDRLLKSDFSGPLETFIGRRDPGVAHVFDAIREFLGSVPPPVLAASERLVETVLRPPLKRWLSLPRTARAAYLRMLRQAIRSGARLDGERGAGVGLRIAATSVSRAPSGFGVPLAAVAMLASSVALRIVRRVRTS